MSTYAHPDALFRGSTPPVAMSPRPRRAPGPRDRHFPACADGPPRRRLRPRGQRRRVCNITRPRCREGLQPLRPSRPYRAPRARRYLPCKAIASIPSGPRVQLRSCTSHPPGARMADRPPGLLQAPNHDAYPAWCHSPPERSTKRRAFPYLPRREGHVEGAAGGEDRRRRATATSPNLCARCQSQSNHRGSARRRANAPRPVPTTVSVCGLPSKSRCRARCVCHSLLATGPVCSPSVRVLDHPQPCQSLRRTPDPIAS
jgi:hypothetical protein